MNKVRLGASKKIMAQLHPLGTSKKIMAQLCACKRHALFFFALWSHVSFCNTQM